MRIRRGNRRVRTRREKLSRLWDRFSRLVARRGKAVLVLGGVAALAWAVMVGLRVLRDSEHFRLRTVAVEGTRYTSPDEVVWICGLRPGEDNLLFTSAHEIEERCASDPRLRFVKTTIEMPDRVTVRVEEHDTVLYVATPTGLWKVNRYGEAWGPADPADLLALPLLVGAEAIMADPDRSRAALGDTLSLIRTITRRPGETNAVGPFQGHGLIISWDEVLGFTVLDSTSGLIARFGWPPFGRKFMRLLQALDEAGRRGLIVEQALVDNEVSPEAVTLRVAPATKRAMAGAREGSGGANARGIALQSEEVAR